MSRGFVYSPLSFKLSYTNKQEEQNPVQTQFRSNSYKPISCFLSNYIVFVRLLFVGHCYVSYDRFKMFSIVILFLQESQIENSSVLYVFPCGRSIKAFCESSICRTMSCGLSCIEEHCVQYNRLVFKSNKGLQFNSFGFGLKKSQYCPPQQLDF